MCIKVKGISILKIIFPKHPTNKNHYLLVKLKIYFSIIKPDVLLSSLSYVAYFNLNQKLYLSLITIMTQTKNNAKYSFNI